MPRPIHPLHAVLLAGTLPLFLGVLLTDLTYYRTFEVQWKNFASWLLVGALVFGAVVLLWSLVDLIRDRGRARLVVAYFSLLLVTWVLGFINALVHAGDAWASMPQGLVLSVILLVLICAAVWTGFATRREWA